MITIRRYTAIFSIICLILSLTIVSVQAKKPSPAHAPITAFTFAVFGDNQPPNAEAPQSALFKEILAEINTRHAAFSVNTGDTVYGAPAIDKLSLMYKDYTDTVSSISKKKVYMAVGNHDISGIAEHESFFKAHNGPLYYSFTYKTAHFIVLDSETVGQECQITGEQLAWLKLDLQKARASKYKFVFLHRPMYPAGSGLGQCMDKYPAERDALHELFVANHVTAVFTGHEHCFNEHLRDGIRYVINGGAGGTLRPTFFGMGGFFHYIVVTIDGNKIEMKAVKPSINGKPSEDIPFSKPEVGPN